MPGKNRLSENLITKLLSITHFRVSQSRAEQIISEISLGSTPALGYYALISAASLIASLGLVANSAAVVIGAMLVSPLMTPIFGMALGMVRGDTPLLARAFRAEFGGVFLAVMFGAVFGSLPVLHEVTPEMLARTAPTLLDLLVAVFAGVAGTLAVIDERISPVLPGVAISTAIVPPLSTCGLCLAVGAYQGAYGAFLLFVANFLAIMLVSATAFVLSGLATPRSGIERKRLFKRLTVTVICFVLVAAVLTHTLRTMLHDRQRTRIIKQVFVESLNKEPATALETVIQKKVKGQLHVLATVRSPKVFTPDKVSKWEQKLRKKVDLPVYLVVRCAISKDICSTGTTSAVIPRTLDGKFLSAKLDPNVQCIQTAEQSIRELFAKRPELTLVDLDLLNLAGDSVILATVVTPRTLLAQEVAEFEKAIRQRLNDPEIKLLVQCQVPVDVTSQGRILLGSAHFGKQDGQARKVEKLARRALNSVGDFHVTNIDAARQGGHWLVRTQIFGPRVISPRQVDKAEQQASAELGVPVKIQALSKAELMVLDDRAMPQGQFTLERLKARAK